MSSFRNSLHVVPPPFEIYRELTNPDHVGLSRLRNNIVDNVLESLPEPNEHISAVFVPDSEPSPTYDPGITPERLRRVVILSQRNAPGDYIANLSAGVNAARLGAALLYMLHEADEDKRVNAKPNKPHVSLEGDKLMFGLSFSTDEGLMDTYRRTHSKLKQMVDTTIVETKPNLVLGVMCGASTTTKRLAEEAFKGFETDYLALNLALEPISVAGKIFDLARTIDT